MLDLGPDGSPVRVALIISDASLVNETILDRYLSSGDDAPDKVLVSRSVGNVAFRLAANEVRVGGRARRALHVMANSFPASSLSIDYRVRLNRVLPATTPEGRTLAVRQAIAQQHHDMEIENAVREVERALAAGAEQVIFFAQNRRFLQDVRTKLLTFAGDSEYSLRPMQVAVLDSSVPPAARKRLVAGPDAPTSRPAGPREGVPDDLERRTRRVLSQDRLDNRADAPLCYRSRSHGSGAVDLPRPRREIPLPTMAPSTEAATGSIGT